MKIYLLIYMITMNPMGAPNVPAPDVQRIEEPSVNVCEVEAATVENKLRHHGCDGVKSGCMVPYLVRTACVMSGSK